MSYAILGFGAVGQALARAFARKNIQVTVASRRAPEAIAPQAKAIGPTVTPSTLQDALKAQIVILAVPFGLQNELAKAGIAERARRSSVFRRERPSSGRLETGEGLQPFAGADACAGPRRQGRAAGHFPVERRRRGGLASGDLG
jgi:NAD(P)-dependent dehydrogenase (short-subunit alcohol dehydrogenase family)